MYRFFLSFRNYPLAVRYHKNVGTRTLSSASCAAAVLLSCSEILSSTLFTCRAGSDKLVELLNQWDLSYKSQVVSALKRLTSKFMLWTDTLPCWLFISHKTLPKPACDGVGDGIWRTDYGSLSSIPRGKEEVLRQGKTIYFLLSNTPLCGPLPLLYPLEPCRGLLFFPFKFSLWERRRREGPVVFVLPSENNIGALEKSVLTIPRVTCDDSPLCPSKGHNCPIFARLIG
jgi:hypothetical protein